MELHEFLLARIAEDVERVSDGTDGTRTSYMGWHTVDCGVGLDYWATGQCECRYVDRVLAECEAKRRIAAASWSVYDTDLTLDTWIETQDHTLRLLALPYADHPDYREEWRP